MQIWSQDLVTSMLAANNQAVTLIFNIEPTGSTFVFNGVSETVETSLPIEKTVNIGSSVTYSISKTGYNPVSETFLVIGPRTINITLNQREMFIVGVDVTPSQATPILTCSEPEFVMSGRSITVPLGSTVSYSFSYYNANDGNTIDNSPIMTTDAITEATTIEYTMTVTPRFTVYKDSVAPGNIVTDQCTIQFNGSSSIRTFNCTADVRYSITGLKGYNWIDPTTAANYVYIAKDTNGVLFQNTAVTLTKKAYAFGVVLNNSGITQGVTIHISINGAAQQTVTSGETVTVYIGDTIWWETVYNNIQQQQDTVTLSASVIDNNNDWYDSVHGVVNGYVSARQIVNPNYNVSLSATPEGATITLVNNTASRTYTGNPINATVTSGDSISYYATYAGVTSSTVTATVTNNYSDTIALDPTVADVAVVTTTQAVTLYPGVYGYICVGAGAAGATGGSSSTSYSSRTGIAKTTCGKGGYGGCSGYVTKGTFIVSAEGAYTFSIGQGGTGATTYNTAGPAGGVTSLIDPNGVTIASANGGEETPALVASIYSGGSGGGGYAPGGYITSSGTVQLNGTAGDGGNGGGNGYSSVSRTGTVLNYYGMGYYATTKSVGGTAGATITVTTFGFQLGNPGGGGVGLVAVENTIKNRATFTSIVTGDSSQLQMLYNSIAGGGGGGAGNAAAGGPGGGGAGWANGSNGSITSGDVFNGGNGGNGAIVYARIAWE